jgi:hypothetical protein
MLKLSVRAGLFRLVPVALSASRFWWGRDPSRRCRAHPLLKRLVRFERGPDSLMRADDRADALSRNF